MKISTVVKTKTSGFVWIDTCYTLDCGLETMVFPCTENGVVTDWMDLDCDRYFTESTARAGHELMVKKWENM